MNNGQRLNLSFPSRSGIPEAAAPERMIAWSLRAFSGSSRQGRDGKISRIDIPILQPVGDDSDSGMSGTCSKTCGVPFSQSRTTTESYIGRSVCGCKLLSRKKRGAGVGKTKRGKGTKCMVLVDGQDIPLGSHTDSASPAELTLLDTVIGEVRVPKRGKGMPRTRPKRIIGDKA